MGYFNFKWQVYSASATRRTYDRNTDKGEVGGSSPPKPTSQIRTIRGYSYFSPFRRSPSKNRFVNRLSTLRLAGWRHTQA
jgi:hypothetical protein